MGSGRTLNKKPRTRPVKSEGARRRREAVQAQRLVALGIPQETVDAMQPGHIRTALLRPFKVKAFVTKVSLK